jgi:hypothetical protein
MFWLAGGSAKGFERSVKDGSLSKLQWGTENIWPAWCRTNRVLEKMPFVSWNW